MIRLILGCIAVGLLAVFDFWFVVYAIQAISDYVLPTIVKAIFWIVLVSNILFVIFVAFLAFCMPSPM